MLYNLLILNVTSVWYRSLLHEFRNVFPFFRGPALDNGNAGHLKQINTILLHGDALTNFEDDKGEPTLPRMGKSRFIPRHPVRLMHLFVAGILVFFTVHPSLNLAPALKPHRLERAQLPEQDKIQSHIRSIDCRESGASPECLAITNDHNFVHGFLSLKGVVTAASRTQIGVADGRSLPPALPPTGPASPRGPPRTVS